MEFNLVLILVILLLALDGAFLIRVLATGRWGFGSAACDRRDRPVEFWFSVAVGAIAVPLFAAAMLAADRAGDDPPSAAIIVIPLFGLMLLRLLQTGRAPVGSVEFDRREEPREYWLIVVTFTAVLALMLWDTLDSI